MNDNKAPGPDGISIEFYKAFFCNEELEKDHLFAERCLQIIFNKFRNGSFLTKWNLVSIVSIPRKVISPITIIIVVSLINVGLKIISKIVTNRISNYALNYNYDRPE